VRTEDSAIGGEGSEVTALGFGCWTAGRNHPSPASKSNHQFRLRRLAAGLAANRKQGLDMAMVNYLWPTSTVLPPH